MEMKGSRWQIKITQTWDKNSKKNKLSLREFSGCELKDKQMLEAAKDEQNSHPAKAQQFQ